MGVSFLVSDIQERVRVRCGLPAYSANTNITTAMILSMVQESARELAAMVNELDWYFVTTGALNTAANVATVALPANFGQLFRLTWLKSSNEVVELDRANLENVHPVEAAITWETTRPVYRFKGDALEFFPTPTKVYPLELRYSTGIFIASAGDTLVGQSGWDTWIVYNCCCIVRQRQEKDYGEFALERDRKLVEIMRTAGRDRTGIAQPRDVRGGLDSGAREWRWWEL